MPHEHPGRIRLDGERCLRARRRKALSREALADRAPGDAPISVATIKRAEKGRTINLDKARTIAEVLDVELGELLPEGAGDDGTAPPPAADEARSALVDRSDELKRLGAVIERGWRRRPAVVLVEGEAGIGKTRLLREAGARVLERGGVYGRGESYEGGAGPFAPLVAAIAPSLDALGQRRGEDAARIDSFLRQGAPRPGAERSWSDQVVFRALSRALLAAPRLTLIAVDDLQWADQATLALFGHLAGSIVQAVERREAARLVLVGCYRAGEISEQLLALANRLKREECCEVLRLEPLDEADTFELVTRLGVDRPSPQLIATLREVTRGNPLFLGEMIEMLRQRGELVKRGGYTGTSRTARDLDLPEGVTSVISSRAHDELSREGRRALVRAAFLGTPFELEKLAFVLDTDPDELLELLEEAVSCGLLQNDGQVFAFAHPLVRHVFYRNAIAARRQRIHREIAQRLEAWYGAEAERHAAEIADHLMQAGEVASSERLMHFARLAAEQAFDTFAWAAAARFNDAVLAAGRRRGQISDAETGELHRRTALALHRHWDVGPAREHYDAAIAAFERAGDAVGAARALADRVRLSENQGDVPYGGSPDATARLERALERIGDSDLRLRGQILDTLAMCHWSAGEPRRAERLAREALAIGERTGDDELRAQVSTSLALSYLQRLELRAALECWDRGVGLAQRAGDPLREGRCLQRIPIVHYVLGDLDAAASVAERAWQLAGTIPNLGEASLSRAIQALLALLRGDLAGAERRAEETLGLVERLRYVWAGPVVFPTRACLHALHGDRAAARRTLARMTTPGVVFEEPARLERAARRYALLIDAWTDPGAARDELREVLSDESPPPRRDRFDIAAVTRLCTLVELADRAGEPAAAAGLYDDLRFARERGVVLTHAWPHSVPRLLGVLAAARGQPRRAARHFAEAIDWAQRGGAQLELARARLDYARVLAPRRSARARARELASEARAAFEDIGAAPFARDAHALSETLAAPGATSRATSASSSARGRRVTEPRA